MSTTEERISKLPKWARSHIAMLQANLDAANERVSSVFGEESSYRDMDHAEIYISVGHEPGYRQMPPGSRIIFPVGDGRVEVRSSDRGDRGEIQIMGISGGSLLIKPQVSNVIHVSVGR